MFEHSPVSKAVWRQFNWLAMFKDQTKDCNAYRRPKKHDAAPAPKQICSITGGSRISLDQPHTNGRKEGTESDKANELGIGFLNYDVILRSCTHGGIEICDFCQPSEAEAFLTRKVLMEAISSSPEISVLSVACGARPQAGGIQHWCASHRRLPKINQKVEYAFLGGFPACGVNSACGWGVVKLWFSEKYFIFNSIRCGERVCQNN
jgi:hypothetical protein